MRHAAREIPGVHAKGLNKLHAIKLTAAVSGVCTRFRLGQFFCYGTAFDESKPSKRKSKMKNTLTN
jgi:hypothetical protein